jgi:hypothetical protein
VIAVSQIDRDRETYQPSIRIVIEKLSLMPTVSKYAMRSSDEGVCPLRGLITEADLPLAEKEWPGLHDFLLKLPAGERPSTFLDLIWRFEGCRLLHQRAA